MPYINFNDRKIVKIWEGITVSLYHSEQATFAYVTLQKGAEAAMHHHPHEQWTHVIEGEMIFNLDGDEQLLKPGMAVFIPSNLPHGARSVTGCRVIDCFLPVREDFVELEKNTP